MRLTAILILLVQLALGYEYNTFLLKSQIDLYPKILLFDRKFAQKIDDGVVDFFILYEPVDRYSAQRIVEQLRKKYRRIGRFKVRFKALNVLTFLSDKNIKADALYILKMSPNRLEKVAKRARNIYTFVYDVKDLREGFLVGLEIEKDIRIVMNKKILQRGDFDFINEIYLMARFVE